MNEGDFNRAAEVLKRHLPLCAEVPGSEPELCGCTMVMKGVPEHFRSDNGPEFVAKDLRKWLAKTGPKTLYIEPGSPWENGYCESFNSKLQDEFLNGRSSTR